MARRTVSYQGTAFDLSYELVNPSAAPTILFLHGWGSNKGLMKMAFGHTFASYRHLYLDMPGFGDSIGEAILTTADYAAIIQAFLSDVGIEPQIIFGHSFGGKVGTLLDPPLLVYLSTAGIVAPKSLKVRAKIALFKLLKPLGGATLYKLFATKDAQGMSRTMYETLKRVVDEDFSALFAARTKPTAILWGREDYATPLSSGEKIAALMPHALFKVFNGDHYFFLKEGRGIEEALTSLLAKKAN